MIIVRMKASIVSAANLMAGRETRTIKHVCYCHYKKDNVPFVILPGEKMRLFFTSYSCPKYIVEVDRKQAEPGLQICSD